MRIESIDHRRVYDSHLGATAEYTVRLDHGGCGRGASPHGETTGIYERETARLDPAAVIASIRDDGFLRADIDQQSFDDYLGARVTTFGKNTCYALSLALFRAAREGSPGPAAAASGVKPPRLCCNILNGGLHAYTNAVLSNFSEYMLVARSDDLSDVIAAHGEIQRAVHDRLLALDKAVVNGNPVSRFSTVDDRECVEFLLSVRDDLGYSRDFDLMIDAATAGLQEPGGYRLAVTGDAVRSSEDLYAFWLSLINDYPLRFLEDPFGERDTESWTRLTTSQSSCRIIGDDLYATDADRIAEGVEARWTSGAIIKPNQAGTVSATVRAARVAAESGQTTIASHRSVSTEDPFEATLACDLGLDYIKIGPLLTDYSSVIRLNEIIRLTEGA